MSCPKVSVVIPTYNRRDLVLDALGSVFAQTMTDHEIIVINDESLDDTEEVLAPLAESGRIRYIRQDKAGQAAALNLGISEACGEFVAFLDDDDMWPADRLEWQVKLLESLPRHVAVTGNYKELASETIPDQIADTRDLSPADFMEGALMRSPGQVLFRRQALLDVGGFDLRVWCVQDWDLYFRISALGPIRYEPHPALLYRVHEGNASKNYWRMYKNALRVYRKHRSRDPKYNPLRWIWGNPPLARVYRYQADAAAQEVGGAGRLLHKLRARWCAVCLIPEDAVVKARIYGGLVRRRLRRGKG